ncbi:MAG: deoxyribonuclease IV [Rubrobacteridae bacterium]|nr:deoxyribonuclease IV [Rubrobacteridae bacterium]
MAGQGTTLGSNFEEMAEIIERLDNRRLTGVCFDTAHVFAAGYDISIPGGYSKILEEFDSIVGIDRIGLFHINDSKTGLGSHHDRHTYIGEGEIGVQAFTSLLQDQRLKRYRKCLSYRGEVTR